MNKTRIVVSISEDCLNEIDKIAKEEKRSRSDLFREAITFYLRHREKFSKPIKNPRIKNAIAIQDNLASQDTFKDWDSVMEIRRWREKR